MVRGKLGDDACEHAVVVSIATPPARPSTVPTADYLTAALLAGASASGS
jgi:hypothetical protein